LHRYTEAKHVEDAVKSGGLAEIKVGQCRLTLSITC